MSICINVVNQKMYVASTKETLVSGSQKFICFKFNLNEDWDGLLTFAQFRQNNNTYNQYLNDNNEVYLPAEIGAGTCTLMLYGSHNDVIATTNYITFKITKDILISDAQSTEISESLYNQLVARFEQNLQQFNERASELESEFNKVIDKGIGGIADEVHIGADEPEDENVKIWIDPNEDGDSTFNEVYIGADEPEDENIKVWYDIGEGDSDYTDDSEEYFEITTDGIVSLKPKYRGEVNFDKYKTVGLDFSGDYTYAISDNGENYVGSKNHLLPQDLIIPSIINSIEVKGFQIGAFAFNDRIQTLTIPNTVTTIPDLFADMCINLWDIKGLDNIISIGDKAFRLTALQNFKAENINENGLGNDVFTFCTKLGVINLGKTLKTIGENVFYGCFKLTNVKCKNVNTVGTRAFARTFLLYQCDFLKSGNVVNIGDFAFISSGIPFEWETLGEGSTIGANAIWTKTTNPSIDWETLNYVECENPLPTAVSQKDSRWANEYMYTYNGDNSTRYVGNGSCAFFVIMSAYCGFKDVECSSYEQLRAISDFVTDDENYIPNFFDGMTVSNLYEYIEKLGLTCDYKIASDDKAIETSDIQNIYNALNNGQYVGITIPGKNGTKGSGHIVLAYGVSKDGKLLAVDSSNVGSWHGDKRANTFRIDLKRLTYTSTDSNTAYYIIDDETATQSQLSLLNDELENCLEGN